MGAKALRVGVAGDCDDTVVAEVEVESAGRGGGGRLRREEDVAEAGAGAGDGAVACCCCCLLPALLPPRLLLLRLERWLAKLCLTAA